MRFTGTSISRFSQPDGAKVTEPETSPQRRVLHVIDSLGLGGAQVILKDYFESRTPHGADHIYGLRTVDGAIEIRHPGAGVNASPSRFSVAPLRELRDIVRQWQIDILHCHLFRAQVFGFLAKALYFPRIVLIFHEHGRVVGREGEPWPESLAFRVFLRAAWPRVDQFVCISDYTRACLLRIIPGADRRAIVVSNPIRLPRNRQSHEQVAALRSELAIPVGSFCVGFAARLVERKGWRDFLLAMQSLASRLPVFFLLAGDGEDRQRAESAVRALGLADRGRMMGHFARMDRFFPALDCFVMPSLWEPHGLAHLEAQSYGIPVVVSDVPGLNETVHAELDALLFEAGNPSLLAGQVLRIATDATLRSRLAQGGFANAAGYTMDSFASRLEQIYHDALASRADAGRIH